MLLGLNGPTLVTATTARGCYLFVMAVSSVWLSTTAHYLLSLSLLQKQTTKTGKDQFSWRYVTMCALFIACILLPVPSLWDQNALARRSYSLARTAPS
jgi:hypothetical protein